MSHSSVPPGHYFTENPIAEHDLKLITTTLRGRNLRFYTDSGVFSKGDVDFGSRLLIETMVIPENAKVLDMGCGYGPIGISAALATPSSHVTLADINERALALAAKNAALNGISNVSVVKSDSFASLSGRNFTTILTNPPIRAGKDVVFSIYTGAAAHIAPGGSLWVVIQKKQGAPSTEKKLTELFQVVHLRERSKGYMVFEAVLGQNG